MIPIDDMWLGVEHKTTVQRFLLPNLRKQHGRWTSDPTFLGAKSRNDASLTRGPRKIPLSSG